MMAEEQTPFYMRMPAAWLDEIDKRRGKASRAEYVRECIRDRIGRRKFPAARGQGRPRLDE